MLLLGLPALTQLLLGERAQGTLPKVRDCMDDNSWVTSEIVLLVFMALATSNLS